MKPTKSKNDESSIGLYVLGIVLLVALFGVPLTVQLFPLLSL
ncbi:MAG TPA: hypothetical protein VKF40_13955 [Burkholderiales bacterium]|nr:hypothetical protein [Burkholderiales bacterium]